MLPKRTTLLQQQQLAHQQRLQKHTQQLQLHHDMNQRQDTIDKLRLSLAAGANSGLQGPESNHALQDYQLQLMLLEQQNAERLFNARAAQLRQLEIAYAREEAMSRRDKAKHKL
jgi:hypothetical protein